MATPTLPDPSVPRPEKSTTVRSKIALAIARGRIRLAGFVLADGGAANATRLFASPRRFPRPPREVELLARAARATADVLFDAPANEAWSAAIPVWTWRARASGDPRAPGEPRPSGDPRAAAPRGTVLLVHGWEGRGAQLGELVQPLLDDGFDVVTFDAPAHGDAPGARLYLADLIASIDAVARASGPLRAIVAHSFGAIATSMALARGVRAERVAYLAPASLVTGALARFARVLELPEETVARMEHELEARNGFPIRDTLPERVAPVARTAGGGDTPLLIVHGDADDEVPLAESRRLAAAWRGSRLVVGSGLGHRRILRDPDALAAVARFVRAS